MAQVATPIALEINQNNPSTKNENIATNVAKENGSPDKHNGTKSPENGPAKNGDAKKPESKEQKQALKEQFQHFAKFGDTRADGKTIKLSQVDKWLKQATVIDKTLTTTDTAITFNKLKSKTITFEQFDKFLNDLAGQKKLDVAQMKGKLIDCGAPQVAGTTKVVKKGGVDRLTNTQLYTGSHKQRFDAGGKGKGIEGREDIVDKTGYVSGFKPKDEKK